MDRVIIFDTTLRDGEQSPGFSMNAMEKLEMARQLARLNVDVIEAGFPISSEEDFEATRQVARQVGTLEGAPIICGLSRVGLGDIDRCWEAVKHARRSRIHTFVATSDIHPKPSKSVLPDARAASQNSRPRWTNSESGSPWRRMRPTSSPAAA